MQKELFQVMNVKCAGCASNIQNGVNKLGGIHQVEVSIDNGQVIVEGESLNRNQLSHKLAELGYPEA